MSFQDPFTNFELILNTFEVNKKHFVGMKKINSPSRNYKFIIKIDRRGINLISN